MFSFFLQHQKNGKIEKNNSSSVLCLYCSLPLTVFKSDLLFCTSCNNYFDSSLSPLHASVLRPTQCYLVGGFKSFISHSNILCRTCQHYQSLIIYHLKEYEGDDGQSEWQRLDAHYPLCSTCKDKVRELLRTQREADQQPRGHYLNKEMYIFLACRFAILLSTFSISHFLPAIIGVTLICDLASSTLNKYFYWCLLDILLLILFPTEMWLFSLAVVASIIFEICRFFFQSSLSILMRRKKNVVERDTNNPMINYDRNDTGDPSNLFSNISIGSNSLDYSNDERNVKRRVRSSWTIPSYQSLSFQSQITTMKPANDNWHNNSMSSATSKHDFGKIPSVVDVKLTTPQVQFRPSRFDSKSTSDFVMSSNQSIDNAMNSLSIQSSYPLGFRLTGYEYLLIAFIIYRLCCHFFPHLQLDGGMYFAQICILIATLCSVREIPFRGYKFLLSVLLIARLLQAKYWAEVWPSIALTFGDIFIVFSKYIIHRYH